MSQSSQFFKRKGVADGDPMSIAVFFLLLLVMYKWLITAAVTPLTGPIALSSGMNSALSSMTNAVLPLGILVVPLMLLMYFADFLDESGGARGAAQRMVVNVRFAGVAEQKVAGRIGGFVQRTEARRRLKKVKVTRSGVVAAANNEGDY